MQKWGQTRTSKQRFRCFGCQVSGVKARSDNKQRNRLKSFLTWICSKQTMVEYAKHIKTSRQTLSKYFSEFWKHEPQPIYPLEKSGIIAVDGTSVVKRKAMVLIVQNVTASKPLSWAFAGHENFDTWFNFFSRLQQQGLKPSVIVCDAQKGLIKAIRTVWPETVVQRCIIHIHRQARIWLTQHPKTKAGRELLIIVNGLLKVRTKRQKRRWLRMFRKWDKKHHNFLKEKTIAPVMSKRHWWYTHRKIRAVRSLIKNALPDLFRYLNNPMIPRTSNHVEGGVNSRLQELLRCHRGISLKNKTTLTAWYLASRQGRKPTRKFT